MGQIDMKIEFVLAFTKIYENSQLCKKIGFYLKVNSFL